MVATIEVHCWYGSPIADGGAIAGGADLSSEDNCAYSAANRAAHPIALGMNSFEKWMRVKITGAPDNWIGQFKVWGDGAVYAGTTLKYGTTGTGTAPTNDPSIVAVNDFTTAVAGTKGVWDLTVRTPAMIAIDPWTNYLVFQLLVAAGATPGAWTPEVIYYEYMEA